MPRLRTIDVVWLLFLGILAVLGMSKAEHSIFEWITLLALGAFQIAEAPLGISADRRDRVNARLAIGLKLTLCYLLVWETGGVESSYYLIFLLPIVSAAYLFPLWETLIWTSISSLIYLSLLVFVLDTHYVPPEGRLELMVRILFFFLSAILVNRLATENRLKTESLGKANQELSKAQAEVRRSERLAALGQLSAGLAHEIRNPLGVISASAELLAKNISKENEVAEEVAGFIRTEVGRTNELVTRFLDFARPSQIQASRNDLNALVDRAIAQLTESLPAGAPAVAVHKNFAELPPISCDSTLIESALLNLLLNAHQAMPSGGDLHVATLRNGASVVVEITDSGVGIPDDELESIFNPFFTTKPEGVGLGLAMVSKFVDSHGGQITVTSRKGEGSCFRIALPAETT